MQSYHKTSVCRDGRWVNLSIVSGALCISRDTDALEIRRALMRAESISPTFGLLFCILNLLLAIIFSFSSQRVCFTSLIIIFNSQNVIFNSQNVIIISQNVILISLIINSNSQTVNTIS